MLLSVALASAFSRCHLLPASQWYLEILMMRLQKTVTYITQDVISIFTQCFTLKTLYSVYCCSVYLHSFYELKCVVV